MTEQTKKQLDNDDNNQDIQIEQPLKHDISATALELLIGGYVRNIKKGLIIPAAINELFITYYPKQLYMIILNEKTLKLTLADTSRNNVSITSNNIISLNSNNTLNFGGEKDVGICHIQGIEINNLSTNIVKNIDKNKQYNAIFKCGGEKELKPGEFGNPFDPKDCGLILYNQDITPDTFDLYYYQLPSLDFSDVSYTNPPVYSNIYGITVFGTKYEEWKIANLNINNSNNEMEWNIQEAPNELSLAYDTVPSYCFINNGKELFFVNGEISVRSKEINSAFESKPVPQTTIYNLETKNCILLNDNPCPVSNSAVKYCSYSNKIFIGGHINVIEYDLYKHKYFNNLPQSDNSYSRPTIWLNENATLLYIVDYDWSAGWKIIYEWIDLRSPYKWTKNDNIYKLSRKIWPRKQFENLDIIDWQ